MAKSKRSGELYAQASLEDTVGKIDLIAFPASYEKLAESLRIEVPDLVRGSLRGEEDAAPKLAVSGIQALEDVKMRLPEALRIRVPLSFTDDDLLKVGGLLPICSGQRQTASESGRGRRVLRRSGAEHFAVAADVAFIEQVEMLLGRGAVQVIS